MIKRAGSFSILAKPVKLSKANMKYLVNKGQSYGEWAEPGDVNAFAISDFVSPHPEESTAYTSFVCRCMTEIAKQLGKEDTAKLYREYAEGCKKASEDLVALDKFSLDTDRQAKLARPLYLDLLNDEQKEYAKERLVGALDHYGWRLGTGFLSTPFILYVLTEIDPEYAYKMLENENCPGWLFMPKNGEKIVFTVSIPANTEANVMLPNSEMHHVSSGVHLFEVE